MTSAHTFTSHDERLASFADYRADFGQHHDVTGATMACSYVTPDDPSHELCDGTLAVAKADGTSYRCHCACHVDPDPRPVKPAPFREGSDASHAAWEQYGEDIGAWLLRHPDPVDDFPRPSCLHCGYCPQVTSLPILCPGCGRQTDGRDVEPDAPAFTPGQRVTVRDSDGSEHVAHVLEVGRTMALVRFPFTLDDHYSVAYALSDITAISDVV